MAWTTPRTWATNELVTAAMMNEQLRDNLNYLLNPNSFYVASTGTYTTTSTSPVLVNAALAQAMTTYGGAVLLGASFRFEHTTTSDIYISHDGGNHLLGTRVAAAGYYAFTVLKRGIAAGAHTFQLYWDVASGTGTMRGADGGGFVAPPIIFWGIEI